jgi:hypothetical protein
MARPKALAVAAESPDQVRSRPIVAQSPARGAWRNYRRILQIPTGSIVCPDADGALGPNGISGQ